MRRACLCWEELSTHSQEEGGCPPQGFTQGPPPRERPHPRLVPQRPWPQTKHAIVGSEPPPDGEPGTSEEQFAFLSQAPHRFDVFWAFKNERFQWTRKAGFLRGGRLVQESVNYLPCGVHVRPHIPGGAEEPGPRVSRRVSSEVAPGRSAWWPSR